MNYLKTLFYCAVFWCTNIQSQQNESLLTLQPHFIEVYFMISPFQKKVIDLLKIKIQLHAIQAKNHTAKFNKKAENKNSINEKANDQKSIEADDDHRLTLRIPKWLLAKIDVKRKQRVGKISRNLWILETLDKASKK